MFHKAIGFLYISEDNHLVRFAYLDFWGNRVDKDVPLEDIVPFTDASRPLTDFMYKEIEFFSDEKLRLKLYHTKGQITDLGSFIKVFGDYESTEK